jgi:hypothetical protein
MSRFAEFNQAHSRGPNAEYGSPRLADASNMRAEGREELASLLREAATVVEQSSDPTELADVYCFLADAHRTLPKVQAWCVVKHYAPSLLPDAHVWKPAVWTAHLSKEQAEEFAVAIAAHYRKKYPHHRPDEFLVEQRVAGVSNFIHPDCTVERYMRGLS